MLLFRIRLIFVKRIFQKFKFIPVDLRDCGLSCAGHTCVQRKNGQRYYVKTTHARGNILKHKNLYLLTLFESFLEIGGLFWMGD